MRENNKCKNSPGGRKFKNNKTKQGEKSDSSMQLNLVK